MTESVPSIPNANALAIQIVAHAFPDLADDLILLANPVVREHIDIYDKALKECKRVVLVAHSQGNLFANLAYLGIEPTLQSAFGIVSVASPYGGVAGGGPYTIIEEDKVINKIPGANDPSFSNYNTNSFEPSLGHLFVGNYLAPLSRSRKKILGDIEAMIATLQGFDNTDFCGWPATYASNVSLVREPYDKRFNSSDTLWESEIWDEVWQAARSYNLEVQYRIGRSGIWLPLNLRNVRLDYNFYHAGLGLPDAEQLAPFVFIDNGPPSSASGFSKVIEVQPRDVNNGVPFGVQQYRLIIDGKVIDQFTLDYDTPVWIEPKASLPHLDPLLGGSLDITPIPEIP